MRYVKNTRKNIEIEFASVEEIMASAQYREDMRNPKAGTKNATMRDIKYSQRRDTFPNVDAPSKYAGILSDEDLDNALTSPPQWLIDGGKHRPAHRRTGQAETAHRCRGRRYHQR